ncbi:hypothetical protein LSTR_LSTR013169 [Laodelphax striatellus]|uniref:EF-hand domain-containing protein n=1 Tax=Laodelphax striatellus TaxID=195883 RepID=A0A482WR04_LAOST|nr:hypothetical protein LSTR_LSTR013169 [Laodelphax striatellus]
MPVTAVGGLGLEGGSPGQLRRVFALCDPRGTGLVSVEHLAALASQYTNDKEDAANIIRTLDPKGRGHLTYKQFSIAVNSLLLQSGGGQSTMMAPSVDRRDLAAGIATNNNNNNNGVVDDVTLSSSGPESNGKENSRCSSLSDGESYECFGEGDMDTSSPSSQPPSGDGAIRSPSSNSLRRNTWQRTSLRRTTPSNNHENLPNRRWGSFRQTSGKRLGSNALASSIRLFLRGPTSCGVCGSGEGVELGEVWVNIDSSEQQAQSMQFALRPGQSVANLKGARRVARRSTSFFVGCR